MSHEPSARTDAAGILAILACCLAVASRIRSRLPLADAAFLAAASVACFVAWRGGFTRADGHVYASFATLTITPLLLAEAGPNRLRPRFACWFAWTIALVAALLLANGRGGEFVIDEFAHARDLAKLVLTGERRESSSLSSRAPPRIRTAIGDSAVDLLGNDSLFLLGSGIHYRPRPVFQSYSVYTRELDRLNEKRFIDEHRPEWLIARLDAIDGRFVPGEDAAALLAAVQGYEPVMQEQGLLLMRSNHRRLEPFVSPDLNEETRIGEWNEVPAGHCEVLAIDLKSSWMGRARSALLRGAPVTLEVERDDGSMTRGRILPDVVRNGVLLSPSIRSPADLAQLMEGRAVVHARRWRVVGVADGALVGYDDKVRFGLREFTAGGTLACTS